MTLGLAAAVTGLPSCVGDLDLEPTNPNEITNVSGDMDRVFADIFLNFSTFGASGNSPVSGFDGGMASFQRALFIAEEIPTDEAAWLWDPSSYGTINQGIVVPTVDAVFGFYSRLMINITLCNQFIQSVNDGTFILDDAAQARSVDYVRQAKILRSGCYYYMLSFYDKIPYADETTPVGTLPTQLSRKEVFANVTSTLEEVVADYKKNPKETAYGFVGIDAAQAILAKIYLNAEVFNEGNAAWDKCYQHCADIITRLGKGGQYGNGLAYSYSALFGANNRKYVVGNPGSDVNEIIWTLAQDQVNLISWSGATFLLAGWLGTNGVEVTVAKPTMTEYTLPDGSLDTEKYLDLNEKYCATQEEYDAAKKAYEEDTKEWQKNVSERINGVNYSFDPKAVG